MLHRARDGHRFESPTAGRYAKVLKFIFGRRIRMRPDARPRKTLKKPCRTWSPSGGISDDYGRSTRQLEDDMAKGQVKGNKEAKKPKAEKPKGPGSAYKQSQGKGGQPFSLQTAKKT